MKITDYQIIYSPFFSNLQQEVHTLMEHDWQPLGGVAYADDRIAQVMVRYTEEEEEPELDLDSMEFQAFPKIPEGNFNTMSDEDSPKAERDYRGDLFKGAHFDQWGIGVHAPDDAEVSVTIVRRVRNGQEADRWVEDVKLFLQAEQI